MLNQYQKWEATIGVAGSWSTRHVIAAVDKFQASLIASDVAAALKQGGTVLELEFTGRSVWSYAK